MKSQSIPHFYLWLNGSAHEGCGNRITVHNPFDDTPVGTVSMAGSSDLESAIAGCQGAFFRLRELPRHERASILERMAALLLQARDELIDAIVLEAGKPRRYAEIEFDRSHALIAWAAAEARRFCGEMMPLDGMQRGVGYEGYSLRRPLGPLLAITPFNFPLNLVVHKVAPALAVGCSVLLKPSLQTPICALILARLASEAGAPPGSLNVLPMTHADTELALRDPRLTMLSFTGSPVAGWRLRENSGRKRVSLELGGSSGTIVDAGCDVADVAARLALGGFAQAGQSCIAVQRIYAHRTLYQPLLAALIAEARSFPCGAPHLHNVLCGPMIDDAACQRVDATLQEAIANGATLHCGGQRLSDGAGRILMPTVVGDVDESMSVQRDEIFAPVITLARFDDIDEAIKRVNGCGGLHAALFSNRFDHISLAIDRLEAGGVVINDTPTFRSDQMPYGGVGAAGQGREGVRSAMLAMSEEKMVVLRRSA